MYVVTIFIVKYSVSIIMVTFSMNILDSAKYFVLMTIVHVMIHGVNIQLSLWHICTYIIIYRMAKYTTLLSDVTWLIFASFVM